MPSVTRLIKASSKKPTRDSVLSGPSSPSASVLSFGTSGQPFQHRMTAAQAELQGCERQLAEKQRQLDQIRSIAIRDGLEQRCNALAQLGVILSEKGNDGVRALQEGFAAPPVAPNGIPPINIDDLFRNLPPRPSSPNGLSDASLAPSQSASQLGAPSVTKSPSLQPNLPAIPTGNALQNGAQPTQPDDESSDSDHGPLQVVENTAPSPSLISPRTTIRDSGLLPHRAHSSDIGPSTSRTATLPKAYMRRQNSSSSSAAASEPRKRGIFGAFASFLKGGGGSKGSKASADPDSTSTLKQGNTAWHTRTDRNLARTRNETSGSEDEEGRGHFVTIENKPGAQLTLSPPPGEGTMRRKGAPNRKASSLVGPAPRKLTRASSTSRVPGSKPPVKKGRKTGSVADVPTGAKSPTPPPPPPMRAGTVTSHTGSSSARHRTASLPGAPGVSPPNQPPPRNAARGKPLKLTGAVEKDPAAWIHGPNSPTSPHHRSSSVKSSPSSSPSKSHQRSASLDIKAPNLMTLVEDVVADRQRLEVLKPVYSTSDAPHMMLPSEYVKATAPAHGYGNKSGPSRNETTPVFTVQPPTPGEHSRSHSTAHEAKGKGKETETRHYPQSPNITEIKHNPPSRSASPLRSALRHPASSLAYQNNGLPPKPTLVTIPGPVVAPVPVRPALISSSSVESDAASAYETAHSESSGEEGDATATPKKDHAPHNSSLLTPTAPTAPVTNGGPPSEPSTLSASTELGGADGVTRRKSVRLNVPPTPEGTESSKREKPLPQPGSSATSAPKRVSTRWNSRIADPDAAVVPDAWADSSEEDEAYKRARRALSRADKKEKAAHAEAIAVVASSAHSSKRRHSVKR